MTHSALPEEWQNWSGSVVCRPVSIAAPTTEAEVCALVARAARDGHAVRVAGTGHSFVPLCASDAVNASGVLEENQQHAPVVGEIRASDERRSAGRMRLAAIDQKPAAVEAVNAER